MIRHIVTLALMFFAGRALAGPAESLPAAAPSAEPQQVLSKEDADALRADMLKLAAAMGAPTSTVAAQASDAPSEMTMPKLADKALDMAAGVVAKLSQTFEKVAPEIWRVMIRQQYVKALTSLWPLLAILCCVVFSLIIGRFTAWRTTTDDDDRAAFSVFHKGIPLVLGCILSIFLVYNVTQSIGFLLNPEYYAVRDILVLITDPKMLQ